jgi:thiol-disulfide isomerase/thioredoxin
MLFLCKMKKYLVLLLTITSLLQGLAAQTDSADIARPPYKRFPQNLPLQLLLPDSTTKFTREDFARKKPVLLMLFSPDCEHCKHETESIIREMERFKKIQIVMATTAPLDRMREYIASYGLDKYNNIVVGKDVNYLLPVYFDLKNYPFLAFYNGKKELIDVVEGALPIEKVLAKFGL